MGGTSNNFNETCSQGHIGAYCEVCDIYAKYWNESYSNAPGYTCSKCSESTNNALLLTGVNIVTLVRYNLNLLS